MSAAHERRGPDEAVLNLDRDHLLRRLERLRSVLPVFAQELSTARRQAAHLRTENHRLIEQIRRMQRERTRHETTIEPAASPASDGARRGGG